MGSRFGRYLALAALVGALAEGSAFAQVQPSRFPGGFQRPGHVTQPNPEELSAYQAALAQQDPADRISAIQQFLTTYPTSGLRQTAISALLAAQRQIQAGQGVPAPSNPRIASPPAPSAAVAAPMPAAPTAGPPRDSLLQQSAKQAQVTVVERKLEIKADNSALSQILHDVSGATGMKVDGLSKDERIFGNYGPGNARDVLVALLEGSGYNFVMVGDLATGSPRELNLIQTNSSVSTNPASGVRRTGDEEAEEDQDVQQQPPQPEPMQLGQNPPGGESGQPQPRSPQEIMQELQRLRQQNQNQPPGQNPP